MVQFIGVNADPNRIGSHSKLVEQLLFNFDRPTFRPGIRHNAVLSVVSFLVSSRPFSIMCPTFGVYDKTITVAPFQGAGRINIFFSHEIHNNITYNRFRVVIILY